MLLIASDRLLEAEAASTKNRAEYVAAFVKHLARLKEIESFVKTAPAVVREKGVDLATEVRPGSKPEPQDKGWRETDLALATRYREDAEKLLDAAKQSEEKAHALYRLQPVRRSYDRLRKAYRPGTNYIDVLLNASDQLRGAEATAAKTRAEYIAAFDKHLARIKEIEALVEAAPEMGRARAADLAAELLRPGDTPELQDKGWREANLALATTYREDAEQLLNAAKQSEEKAHGLLRLQAARHHYRPLKQYYEEGRITIDRVVTAEIEVIEAERMATENEAQRVTALERIVDLLMEIEDRELAELVVGRGTEADVTAATLNRIEAEIRLRKARSSRETTDVSALERRLSEVERKLDQLLNERKGN